MSRGGARVECSVAYEGTPALDQLAGVAAVPVRVRDPWADAAGVPVYALEILDEPPPSRADDAPRAPRVRPVRRVELRLPDAGRRSRRRRSPRRRRSRPRRRPGRPPPTRPRRHGRRRRTRSAPPPRASRSAFEQPEPSCAAANWYGPASSSGRRTAPRSRRGRRRPGAEPRRRAPTAARAPSRLRVREREVRGVAPQHARDAVAPGVREVRDRHGERPLDLEAVAADRRRGGSPARRTPARCARNRCAFAFGSETTIRLASSPNRTKSFRAGNGMRTAAPSQAGAGARRARRASCSTRRARPRGRRRSSRARRRAAPRGPRGAPSPAPPSPSRGRAPAGGPPPCRARRRGTRSRPPRPGSSPTSAMTSPAVAERALAGPLDRLDEPDHPDVGVGKIPCPSVSL